MKNTRKITLMAMLFALAMVFSFIENLIPAVPFLPIGAKLGLSNIVTMYCLFCLGNKEAFTMSCLKSLFVLLSRSPVSAIMSLSGGIMSVLLMSILLLPKKYKFSIMFISIIGAVSHNVGQLLMSSVILSSTKTLYYLPFMIFSGIVMGVITGISVSIVIPYIRKIQ